MNELKRFIERTSRRRYELIAVLNGAIVLVLEIIGARFIEPYFGNSIYVWTAVIGVILGALSLGYWYGGRLADRNAKDRWLGIIFLVAAAVLMFTLYIKDVDLSTITRMGGDIRWEALLSSVVLFGPVNFLLGIVSPYLVKLRLTTLESAGRSVGSLYAAGTAGSIVGTFITGYWLISWFGSRTLGAILVYALIGASALASRRTENWARLIIAVLNMGLIFNLFVPTTLANGNRIVLEADSAYTHWRVIDQKQSSGDTLRYLATDPSSAESGILLGHPAAIPFRYIQRFVDVAAASPHVGHVLVIGGGAYTLPRLLLSCYPEAQIDVIEIDPEMDELATRYFNYQPDKRIHIAHQDGRVFLNSNKTKYDLIYMDAFNSLSPPFQLTTTEAAGHLAESLAPGGVVAVNIVTPTDGSFAKAERATYIAHFASVWVAQDDPLPSGVTQNLLMVAGANQQVSHMAEALKITDLKSTLGGRTLTDDFAPVEQMTAATRN